MKFTGCRLFITNFILFRSCLLSNEFEWMIILEMYHVNNISNGMKKKIIAKGHSFCDQCLHDLQFKKIRSSLPNLFKQVRADITCQFMKIKRMDLTHYFEQTYFWILTFDFAISPSVLICTKKRLALHHFPSIQIFIRPKNIFISRIGYSHYGK